MAYDFLCTVYRIGVHSFTNAHASLVLHASFHQINGVNHEGTKCTCYAAQCEMMHRLKNSKEKALRLMLNFVVGFLCDLMGNSLSRFPRGVHDLGKVLRGQSIGINTEASKVEENIDLHWCDMAIACCQGGLIQKLSTTNLSVLTLSKSTLHDTANYVHAVHNIFKGPDISIRNFTALCHLVKRVQML